MRPINKGDWPVTPVRGIRKTFTDWSEAIPFLKERTGTYCHLCEMRVTNALAIEHIMPRKPYPDRASDWDNFLLACHSCNSSKGSKTPLSPYRAMYYWPHLHNTALAFEYGTDLPLVKPSGTLNRNQRAKAIRLIRLYGLNKQVTVSGESDPRWLEKMQTLKYAIDSLIEYHRNPDDTIDPV